MSNIQIFRFMSVNAFTSTIVDPEVIVLLLRVLLPTLPHNKNTITYIYGIHHYLYSMVRVEYKFKE
jgi:hypothetical protein